MYATFPNRIARLPSHLTVFSCGALLLAYATGLAADHSATARHLISKETYSVSQKSNRLAAGSTALTQCKNAHVDSMVQCELTEIDNEYLRTTAEIKARVPLGGHPLYLWRYVHGDATVYLAGSIHMLKPGFYPLARQYELAFASSEFLVVEVDTEQTSPANIEALSLRYGRLPQGQTLSTVLPTDAYNSLAQMMARYGIHLSHFENLKPNLAIQQLTVLALLSIGYNPDAGLEAHFRRIKANRPVLELETFEFQLDLLYNAPLTTQIQMTEATIEEMASFETITTDLIAAWLSGNDEAFKKATDAQSGDTPEIRTFMEKLINKRNHSMTQKLTSYLRQAGTYFVLVGAAHLIGDEGIPNLLDEAGYQGHRLTTDDEI